MTKYPRAATIEGNDDAPLVHVPQGEQEHVGDLIARYADHIIRDTARAKGADLGATSRDKLCPPCYMVAMVNALVTLAEKNGQTPEYLSNSVSDILAWVAREHKAKQAFATALGGGQDGDERIAAVELGKRVFSGLRGPVSRYCDFMDAADPEALKARDAADGGPRFPSVATPSATGDKAYDDYVDDYWLGYTPGARPPLTRPDFLAQIAKQEAERFGGTFKQEHMQQWPEGHGDNFVHPTRIITGIDLATGEEVILNTPPRPHRYDHD